MLPATGKSAQEGACSLVSSPHSGEAEASAEDVLLWGAKPDMNFTASPRPNIKKQVHKVSLPAAWAKAGRLLRGLLVL